MFLGITAYIFLFIGAGIIDISLSDHLFIPSEALFVIFNDPSLSNNTSISFVLCELVLSLCGLHHMCFVCLLVVTLPNCPWTNHYVPLLLQGELCNALPNVMTLG